MPPVTPNAITPMSIRRPLAVLECFQDAVSDRFHAMRPRSFGFDNLPQPLDRRLELVVDNDVVIVEETGGLGARGRQPALHLFLSIFAASSQPLFELRERRRQHKNSR